MKNLELGNFPESIQKSFVDTEIQKGRPPAPIGTVDKYGYIKQGDGSWKKPKKGAKEEKNVSDEKFKKDYPEVIDSKKSPFEYESDKTKNEQLVKKIQSTFFKDSIEIRGVRRLDTSSGFGGLQFNMFDKKTGQEYKVKTDRQYAVNGKEWVQISKVNPDKSIQDFLFLKKEVFPTDKNMNEFSYPYQEKSPGNPTRTVKSSKIAKLAGALQELKKEGSQEKLKEIFK